MSEAPDEPLPSARQINELLLELWADAERNGPSYTDFALTNRQHIILTRIAGQPQITAKDLAAELGVTKGAISQQLAALENEGFIRRRRSQHDHRVQLLELYGKGETYRDSLRRYEEKLATRFDRTLSREDVAQIAAALQKLKRIFAD